MAQLLQQAQQMQQQLVAAQEELANTEVTGSAGGGLVTATMTGSGELTALTIAPSVVDPDDVDTLQDLVVAAVRDASRAAAELTALTIAPAAVDPDDIETLQDLVVAAVRDAKRAADELAATTMGPLAGGLGGGGLGLPGF